MKNRFIVALLTALIGGIIIILSYSGSNLKTFPSFKTSSIKGFRLTHKEGNEVKWELVSENATLPEGGKEIVLEGLMVRTRNGHEFSLTGGSGIYNIEQKNLTINRPVKINMHGTILSADTLTWNVNKGFIAINEDVKVEGRNFLIQGRGLNVNVNNQEARILGNVKGVFYQR